MNTKKTLPRPILLVFASVLFLVLLFILPLLTTYGSPFSSYPNYYWSIRRSFSEAAGIIFPVIMFLLLSASCYANFLNYSSKAKAKAPIYLGTVFSGLCLLSFFITSIFARSNYYFHSKAIGYIIPEFSEYADGFNYGFFIELIIIICVVALNIVDMRNMRNNPSSAKQVQAGTVQVDSLGLTELEKLAELKDKGIITSEEFNEKKKQILGH